MPEITRGMIEPYRLLALCSVCRGLAGLLHCPLWCLQGSGWPVTLSSVVSTGVWLACYTVLCGVYRACYTVLCGVYRGLSGLLHCPLWCLQGSGWPVTLSSVVSTGVWLACYTALCGVYSGLAGLLHCPLWCMQGLLHCPMWCLQGSGWPVTLPSVVFTAVWMACYTVLCGVCRACYTVLCGVCMGLTDLLNCPLWCLQGPGWPVTLSSVLSAGPVTLSSVVSAGAWLFCYTEVL